MPVAEKSRISARDVTFAYCYAFAGWGGFALLMASQELVIARSGNSNVSFLHLLTVPAIRSAITALLTPPLYFFVLKWPFSRQRLWVSILRYLALAVGFAFSFSFLRWLAFPAWDYVHKQWLPRSFDSLMGFLYGGFADQFIMLLIMVTAAHVWVLGRQSQMERVKQSNLKRDLAELELQLLQMQLHPHFIFNTLHGINTLMERDVDTAKTMLLHLADLLRAAISLQSQDLIPLKQELEFISSYVELEKMRLGSRLQVTVDVEENAQNMLVPQMILQPIVENAILHGAAAARMGGWVNIACRTREESVVLETLNSATTPKDGDRKGLGLRNTRARLQNLFEDAATLEFEVRDGVASTRMVLPKILAQEPVTQ